MDEFRVIDIIDLLWSTSEYKTLKDGESMNVFDEDNKIDVNVKREGNKIIFDYEGRK